MPRSIPIKEGTKGRWGGNWVVRKGHRDYAGGFVDWTGVSDNRGWVVSFTVSGGTAPQIVLASNNDGRLPLIDMWYANVMTANCSCPSLDRLKAEE
jgi:hypothetical protein